MSAADLLRAATASCRVVVVGAAPPEEALGWAGDGARAPGAVGASASASRGSAPGAAGTQAGRGGGAGAGAGAGEGAGGSAAVRAGRRRAGGPAEARAAPASAPGPNGRGRAHGAHGANGADGDRADEGDGDGNGNGDDHGASGESELSDGAGEDGGAPALVRTGLNGGVYDFAVERGVLAGVAGACAVPEGWTLDAVAPQLG